MTRTTSGMAVAVFAVAVCTLLANRAVAALIVYEGFGDYSAGDLTGKSIGSSTIGLDKTKMWENSSAFVWDIVPTGLAIGSGGTALKTSPGAVVHKPGSSVLAAQLDLTNYVGTLYASYLYNIDLTQSTQPANGVAFVVIGEGTLNNSNRRFRQLARNSTAELSPVGVNYTNGATAGTGHVNVTNTTFMILSRFTRVGEAVDATTPGMATLWALSSDQFDYFKANGFAGIDSAIVGSASNEVTGMASHTYSPATADLRALNSTLHLQLGSAIARPIDITFDEVRMGDSFDAVTPVVPEPASFGLAVLAGVSWSVVRRRCT